MDLLNKVTGWWFHWKASSIAPLPKSKGTDMERACPLMPKGKLSFWWTKEREPWKRRASDEATTVEKARLPRARPHHGIEHHDGQMDTLRSGKE